MAHLSFTNPDVLRSSGEFLSRNEASEYLKAFFESESPSVLGDVRSTIVSGQVLGLEQLKIFMDNIERYNGNRGEDKEIVAVRIYPALSEREVLPGRLLKDIILEPVLDNGQDYHKLIEAFRPDGLLMGKALPCPNLCNLAFDCFEGDTNE